MTKGELVKALSTLSDDIEVMVKMPDWYPYKYEDLLSVQMMCLYDQRDDDGSIFESEDDGKITLVLYPDEVEW